MKKMTYFKRAVGISERIVIRGELLLTSPTSLGNGDTEGLVDTPLRRDEVDQTPMLPGATLAGALRSYLWDSFPAHGNAGLNRKLVSELFGNVVNDESRQSWLFISDALAKNVTEEVRDGVCIDPKTRTAAKGKTFDLELLGAGTLFPIRLEFWKPLKPGAAAPYPDLALQALVLGLTGLEKGHIRLGARKRRGFGQCKVKQWQVVRYDWSIVKGLLAWLDKDETATKQGVNIGRLLGLAETAPSARDECHLTATFQLDGCLLIRAAPAPSDRAEIVHLKNAAGAPVLSGTSIAGVLRARAERITHYLRPHNADAFLADLFGPRMEDRQTVPCGSRMWVKEVEIKPEKQDLVQHRVKIDRFTGGSYPGALFDEQPVFGGTVTIDLAVRRPSPSDVGLLLLLLKDLWTGDLPLGGASSVGRGRLRGHEATLDWSGKTWLIKADPTPERPQRLKVIGEAAELQRAVDALTLQEPLAADRRGAK